MKQGARIKLILLAGLVGILATAYLKGYFKPEFWAKVNQRGAKPSADPKVMAAAEKTFAAAMITGPASREGWVQVGGPHRTGVVTGQGLPEGWASKAPRKVWTAEVGPGYGGAAIDGGEAFLLDRFEDTFDILRCYDLASGEEKWSAKQERPGRLSYNGSRAVPAITAERIIVVNPFGNVYAYDRAKRALAWQKDTVKEFGARGTNFGISQSPLIHNGLAIITTYGQDCGVIALDVTSGELRWKSESIGGGAHPSPVLQTIHGVEQVVALAGTALVGLDPSNGKELWRYRGWKASNPIANPLVFPDGRIFLSAGYGSGSQMVVLRKDGDAYTSDLAYQIDARGTQIHQVMFHKDRLYANFNTNENGKNPEGVVCLKLNGELAWNTGKEYPINRGALLMVDSTIISLSASDGTLRFIEAGPDEYKLLNQYAPFSKDKLKRKGNNLFAPMALGGRSLLVRSNNELVCLELGGGA